MVAAFNKIPFAIREADRKIVSIEDVPRGLACACRCPSCDARLQARKETLGQIQSISTPDFLWVKEIIIRGRENVALTFGSRLVTG